jgi:hypothetical protein
MRSAAHNAYIADLILQSSLITTIIRPVEAMDLEARAVTGRKRVDVHIDGGKGWKRKRVQPRGSKPCPNGCGQVVSANAELCAVCSKKK